MNLGLTYVTAPDGSKMITIPDETRAAVIAFVREGGTKTPVEIEMIIQLGHDELVDALAGLSESQAAYKPDAGGWSVLELMDHVVSVKQIMAMLCRNLADGHWPPGLGAEFEEQRAQDGVTVARFATLADARTACEAGHQQLLDFVRSLDESTNVEARFKHFLFGAFNAREWPVFQRIHDGDHTPQMAQIKASPGFPVK